MIGQLPPDFFHKFFIILNTSSDKAWELEQKISSLCQRQWLKAQMDVLPEIERASFSRIMAQDGVSAATLNDFLEQRLDQDKRIELWHEALMVIWGQVFAIVEQSATVEQRRKIKRLIASYH